MCITQYLSLIFICHTLRSNTHHKRLWKNVVKLPRSKQRERRYHNNRNQDLIFWILQLNHRHHHLCHLKRRNHRLRIGLDIRKILDSVFIWVGGGMEMNEGGERCIDKIRRHSQCLCTRPPYNQWATKTTMKLLVYVFNISISHRFLIGQVVKGKHEICYQIGVGLGERDGGMNVHHKASYYLMSDSYKVGSLRLEPGVNYCSSLIPGVTFHLVLSLLVGT